MERETVEYYVDLYGISAIRSTGALLAYAEHLVVQHGDVGYFVEGYEFAECLVLRRPKTDAEIEMDLSMEEFTERLNLCHDKKVHQEAIDRIGKYRYNCIISKLNGGVL